MIRLLQVLTFLLACCSLWAIVDQKQGVVLGVLEDFPGPGADQPRTRALRAMFQKIGDDWKAFPSHCVDQACLKAISAQYPAEVFWTIAFDGKNLGKLSGRTLKEFAGYAEIGRQEIVPGGNVPTIGKRSGEWAGIWDTDVYRPIVVVSQPNFKDPESWKPISLDQSIVAAARAQFKKHYTSLCRIDNTQDTIKQPWKYPESEIKVKRAYASKTGWSVVGLHLENVRDCADEDAGFQVDDPWFAVDPKGTVKFLDTGLSLIDAGDYDGDGESELVFVYIRPHEGGFELFYNNFSKRAVFDLVSH